MATTGQSEAGAWEALQIAPLASPGATWEAAQAGGAPPAPPGLPALPGLAVPLKLCRRCGQQKPYSEFYRSKANADGYDGRCKTCDARQCAERRKKKPRREAPTVEEKACRRCHALQPAENFYRNRSNPDGLYTLCKQCFADEAASRRARRAPLEERTAVHKECRRCHNIKPASAFYRNKLMADGLYSHCKSCYTEAALVRAAAREGPADSKACKRCGETKPSSQFYGSKMTADLLQSYCKACYAVKAALRRRKQQQGSSDDAQQPEEELEELQQGPAPAEQPESGASGATQTPESAPRSSGHSGSAAARQQLAALLEEDQGPPPPGQPGGPLSPPLDLLLPPGRHGRPASQHCS